jgi:hypothetical protein
MQRTLQSFSRLATVLGRLEAVARRASEGTAHRRPTQGKRSGGERRCALPPARVQLPAARDECLETASAESSSYTAGVETLVHTSASCLDGRFTPACSNVQLPGRGRRTTWIDDH